MREVGGEELNREVEISILEDIRGHSKAEEIIVPCFVVDQSNVDEFLDD